MTYIGKMQAMIDEEGCGPVFCAVNVEPDQEAAFIRFWRAVNHGRAWACLPLLSFADAHIVWRRAIYVETRHLY